MADEQPRHIARGVRDVSKVPLAKELVKNNVGSTVVHQEQNSKFVVVSQAASAAASAHYLDPALQARLVPSPTSSTATSNATAAGNSVNRNITGRGSLPYGGDGVDVECTEVAAAEVRPAGQATQAAKQAGDKKANNGPVVIMSDADNYRPDPIRSKTRRKTCCIQ